MVFNLSKIISLNFCFVLRYWLSSFVSTIVCAGKNERIDSIYKINKDLDRQLGLVCFMAKMDIKKEL